MLSRYRWERPPNQTLLEMVSLVSDCSGIFRFAYNHVRSKSTGESKLAIRNLALDHHEKHPSKQCSVRNIIEL